jgi:hypothetical protein
MHNLAPIFCGKFQLGAQDPTDDGVEWIARLRMPPMPGQDTKVDSSPAAKKMVFLDMQSELATMEFIW